MNNDNPFYNPLERITYYKLYVKKSFFNSWKEIEFSSYTDALETGRGFLEDGYRVKLWEYIANTKVRELTKKLKEDK